MFYPTAKEPGNNDGVKMQQKLNFWIFNKTCHISDYLNMSDFSSHPMMVSLDIWCTGPP